MLVSVMNADDTVDVTSVQQKRKEKKKSMPLAIMTGAYSPGSLGLLALINNNPMGA